MIGVALLCTALAACQPAGQALPTSGPSSPPGTTTTSASASASTTSTEPSPNPTATSDLSTTRKLTTTTAPAPNSQPGTSPCAGYPSAACTGVRPGTVLRQHAGNLFVKTPGAVIDGMHITGTLLIRANNVVIRNSQIDGSVLNYDDNADIDGAFPFTITDSTVGTTTCKSTDTAIGTGNFTVERVHIRGFGDGIRASAPNITVRDSFIKLCTNDPSTHADGIQDYPASGNLVFDHNTVDLCGGRVPTDGVCDLKIGYNAPIYVHSNTNGGTRGARITDNLIMGGVYSLFLWPQPGASWVVTGNRVVNGTWTYGPAHTEGLCGEIDQWADNTAVTIDSSYRLTSTKQAIPCPA
ncbi:hypothetical protein [Actinokineospora sp.]|uniref:hypothetical protein n=1 Tax=Actinokineospora sp. TaxID=1872133 RepID=UPI003D6BD4AD